MVYWVIFYVDKLGVFGFVLGLYRDEGSRLRREEVSEEVSYVFWFRNFLVGLGGLGGFFYF